MAQRESVTRAGNYQRCSMYPVRKSAAGARRTKAKPTSDVQMMLNEKNRRNHFADLLHCNFTAEDYFLTLSYRDADMPNDAEGAKKDIRNFIRRVNTKRRKKGLTPVKYVYITERGEKSGRIHHHVFISGGLSREEMEEIWGKGYANSRRLQFDENGLAGLVRYSLKSGEYHADEESEKVGYRTWSCSKGLTQPMRRQNDYRIRKKDVEYIDAHPDDYGYIEKLYPGWRVSRVETTPRSLYDDPEKSPIPRAHFVTVYMYRADAPILGQPVRKTQRKE